MLETFPLPIIRFFSSMATGILGGRRNLILEVTWKINAKECTFTQRELENVWGEIFLGNHRYLKNIIMQ